MPTVREFKDADDPLELTQPPQIAVYEETVAVLCALGSAGPYMPETGHQPCLKKRAQLGARSEFRDITSTPLHRDGQILIHLHCKKSRVHTLLPPTCLCFNFSLQDREKINTGSATLPLLVATEAAQILNHENNMEKRSGMEMEGSEPASKVPRSWWQHGKWSYYWHTTNI